MASKKKKNSGILNSIRSIFSRTNKSVISDYNAPDSYMGMGYVDAFGNVPTPDKARMAQEYETTVYACANHNANAIASEALRIYISNHVGEKPTRWKGVPVTTKTAKSHNKKSLFSDGNIKEICDCSHPLARLIANPNPEMDGNDFIAGTSLSLDLTGTAYWLKDVADLAGHKIITALWLLPSQRVTPNYDERGYVTTYNVTDRSGSKTYNKDQIVKICLYNPLDPYGEGYSPLQAIWETLSITNKIMAHEASLLDKQARPDGVIVGDFGETEAEKTEVKINAKFRHNNGGWSVINSDGETRPEVRPLTFAPKDLAMLEVFNANKVLVANAMGVPMAMLETDQVALANITGSREIHAKNAVIPRMKKIEAAFNKHVVSMFDDSGRTFVSFDDPSPENKEDIRADMQTTATVAATIVGARIATFNEARSLVGLPPRDDGDVLPGDFNLAHLETQEEEDDTTQPILINDNSKKKDCCPVETKAQRASDIPSGDALIPILRKHFRKWERQSTNQVKSFRVKNKELPGAFVPLSKWSKDLHKDVLPVIEMLMVKGSHKIIERVGASPDVFNVTNPFVQDSIETIAMEFAKSTVAATAKSLNTALAEVRSELNTSLVEQGEDIRRLRDRIKTVFEDASDNQAQRIAKSESSRSYHAGMVEAAKLSGVVKGFRLMLSSGACEECVAAAAMYSSIPIDGSYSNGQGIFANQILPVHPNCECTLEALL